MSILDAYIPEGAVSPSTERELLAKITDLLLEHEGVDPTNERVRPLAWVSAGVDTGRLGCPEDDPCRTK
jgi:phenylpyruvate tautomerase PptA (4-oxalocrotonate tautomerase family)